MGLPLVGAPLGGRLSRGSSGVGALRVMSGVIAVGEGLLPASDFAGKVNRPRAKSGSGRWWSFRKSVRFSSCLISAAFSLPIRLASFCLAA